MTAPNKLQTKTERIEELERDLAQAEKTILNNRAFIQELESCHQSAVNDFVVLKSAITAHHSQKADDRCIEDDDKLYAAAGLPPCDRRVGSKAEMLHNCARFIEKRCDEGGWKSYTELEAELKTLRARVSSLESENLPIVQK